MGRCVNMTSERNHIWPEKYLFRFYCPTVHDMQVSRKKKTRRNIYLCQSNSELFRPNGIRQRNWNGITYGLCWCIVFRFLEADCLEFIIYLHIVCRIWANHIHRMSFTLFFSVSFRRMNTTFQLWTGLIVVLIQCITISFASDPKFDPSTRMRLVLVPADAAVGSVIYRLRASDAEFDYPLTFELVGKLTAHTQSVSLFIDFDYFRIFFSFCRRCIIVNSSNRYAKMYKIQFNLPSKCSFN